MVWWKPDPGLCVCGAPGCTCTSPDYKPAEYEHAVVMPYPSTAQVTVTCAVPGPSPPAAAAPPASTTSFLTKTYRRRPAKSAPA